MSRRDYCAVRVFACLTNAALINMFLRDHGECSTSYFYTHQVNTTSSILDPCSSQLEGLWTQMFMELGLIWLRMISS